VAPGVFVGTTMPTAVSGVDDVARMFVQGRQASDCAAATLATYMLEHSPDVEGSCDLGTMRDSFHTTGSFAQLFASILTSPAFATRDIR
jgi:hypothetical protein